MTPRKRSLLSTLPLLLWLAGCAHGPEAQARAAREQRLRAEAHAARETARAERGAGPEAARAVQILTALPPGEALTPTGEVECYRYRMRQLIGAEAFDPGHSARACRADLRSQAGAQGASLIVLVTQRIGQEGCPYCVYLYGTAYRRDPPEQPADEGPGAPPQGALSTGGAGE